VSSHDIPVSAGELAGTGMTDPIADAGGAETTAVGEADAVADIAGAEGRALECGGAG
jgi:hypothetical protein